MEKICVFCGSSKGKNDDFAQAARQLGSQFVERDIGLVFGGGSVGLMGVIADQMLQIGGKVTGVIPHFLVQKEVDHKGVTDMRYVNSMHDRKKLMSELSDAFVALPGGFGTFEELFEILTWTQLGLLEKPVGLLNTAGYYDHLKQMIDEMVDKGFLHEENQEIMIIDSEPENLISRMSDARQRNRPKWLNLERT